MISEATGLRPGELARGVRNRAEEPLRFTSTSKAENAIQSERGRGAVSGRAGSGSGHRGEVPEVSELAKRHHGYFRPESSADTLRFRLREARAEIPGGETLRFYSFRHALKNRLEIEGHSREDIARIMGHRSTRSQENYRAEK